MTVRNIFACIDKILNTITTKISNLSTLLYFEIVIYY